MWPNYQSVAGVALLALVAFLHATPAMCQEGVTSEVMVEAPERAHVGETISLQIKKADAEVSVTLKSAPAGAKLAGEKIEWTPTKDQIGPATFEIQSSRGATSAIQRIQVDVSQKRVKLPFDPRRLKVSADGKHAVLWRSFSAFDPPDDGESPTEIVVVRLDDLSIVAKTSLRVYAADIAVDGDRLFVATQDVAQLICFSLADLKQQKLASIHEPANRLDAVGGKWLVTVSEREGVRRFRQANLTQESTNPEKGESHLVDPSNPELGAFIIHAGIQGRGWKPEVGPVRESDSVLAALRDGWWIGGVVYDSSLAKVRMISDFRGLVCLESEVHILDDREVDGRPAFDTWHLEGFTEAEDVWQLGDRAGMLYAMLGEAEELKKDRMDDGDADDETKYRALQIMGLAAGEKKSRPLAVLAKYREYGPRSQKPRFAMAGRRAVIVLDDELFVYDLAQAKAGVKLPFRFVPDQTILAISDDKPAVLKHRIEGGVAPYRRELLVGENMKFDAKSGDLTVDSKTVRAKMTEAMGRHAAQFGGEKFLQEYVGRVGPKYVELVGRKLTGVPTVVTVAVSAKDAQAAKTTIAYQLVVELDRKAVSAALKKAVAEGGARAFPGKEVPGGGLEGSPSIEIDPREFDAPMPPPSDLPPDELQ